MYATEQSEGRVPSFKGFTLDKEDQLLDSKSWQNFEFRFNTEMSQKGVSEIFHKEASTNPQEAAVFDRLWGTLGNNVGTLFRSILMEAKSKASANENYALTAYIGNLALQKSQLLREWHSFTQHPTE